VFLFDFAIGRTLRYFYFNEISGLHYRTTYSLEQSNAALLIFGASRANHHYIPEIFEDSLRVSFYNTGRDGINIFYQLAVLKSILCRYTPKIIILDYSDAFSMDQESYDRLSSLLPYYKTHKEIRNIVALKSPFENIKQLSEIYPFNSQILTIGIGNLEINKTRKSDNKGYVPLYNEWKDKIVVIDNIKSYQKNLNKVSALHEFLRDGKKSGAKVFLIYSPIFQKFNRNPDVEICREIGSQEKIPFWDFSHDTTFLKNSSLFQDISHLNYKGATIFSKMVVTRIKQETKN
jgi:hypothetical protein